MDSGNRWVVVGEKGQNDMQAVKLQHRGYLGCGAVGMVDARMGMGRQR